MPTTQDGVIQRMETLGFKVRDLHRTISTALFEIEDAMDEIRKDIVRNEHQTIEAPANQSRNGDDAAAGDTPVDVPVANIPTAAAPAPTAIQAPQPDHQAPVRRPTLEFIQLKVLAMATVPVPSSELHKASIAAGRKKSGSDRSLANLRLGGFAVCTKRRWTITDVGRQQFVMLKNIYEEAS